MRAPGRWHEHGHPVVYLAESPAGALLEACAHTSANDVPPNYTLLMIEVESGVSVEQLDPSTLASDGSVRTDADPARVGAVAHTAGIPLTELRSAEGVGLEDMFLALTADTQREGAA